MAATDAVRAYYGALDAGDYGTLQELLASDFVQHRPDRSFEGREAFVTFMREARPVHETTHKIARTFEELEGDGSDAADDADGGERTEVAVRGSVVDENEQVLVDFVDVFTVENDRIVELRTYTR